MKIVIEIRQLSIQRDGNINIKKGSEFVVVRNIQEEGKIEKKIHSQGHDTEMQKFCGEGASQKNERMTDD